MAHIGEEIDEPQNNTSDLQKRQEIKKEGIKEKIIIALISSVLSVVVGYSLHYLTTDEPYIIMITRPAFPQFTPSRVMHVVTVRNASKKLAEEIELTIKGLKDKKHISRITGNPPILSACSEVFSNDGILSLKCGDLKPSGIITMSLEYDNPPININDIEVYSKNAISRKINSDQILESK